MTMKRTQIKAQFNNAALVIVDIQADFCDPDGARGNKQTDRIAKRIARLAPAFRKTGMPIYAVYYADRYVPPHQAGFYQYAPQESDIPIAKKSDSAFKTSSLSYHLESKNIKHLYICGVNFNACVMDTAIDAIKAGYDVSLLKDLCANDNETTDRALIKGATLVMTGHGVKFIHSDDLLNPHKKSKKIIKRFPNKPS